MRITPRLESRITWKPLQTTYHRHYGARLYIWEASIRECGKFLMYENCMLFDDSIHSASISEVPAKNIIRKGLYPILKSIDRYRAKTSSANNHS